MRLASAPRVSWCNMCKHSKWNPEGVPTWGDVIEARQSDSRSWWNLYVHKHTMMLYFVGILQREAETDRDSDILSRLWIISEQTHKWTILKGLSYQLTLYDHGSAFSTFLSRRLLTPLLFLWVYRTHFTHFLIFDRSLALPLSPSVGPVMWHGITIPLIRMTGKIKHIADHLSFIKIWG